MSIIMQLDKFWSPEPIVAYKVFLSGDGVTLKPVSLGSNHNISAEDFTTIYEAICTIDCGNGLLSGKYDTKEWAEDVTYTKSAIWEPVVSHPPHMARSIKTGVVSTGACGWHAFDTAEHAILDYNLVSHVENSKHIVFHLYKVELSGVVVEHESGYRSQYMRLVEKIEPWEIAVIAARSSEDGKNRQAS